MNSLYIQYPQGKANKMNKTEKFMESFDLYCETLREMGVSVEDFTDNELMGWYNKCLNNKLKADYEEQKGSQNSKMRS